MEGIRRINQNSVWTIRKNAYRDATHATKRNMHCLLKALCVLCMYYASKIKGICLKKIIFFILKKRCNVCLNLKYTVHIFSEASYCILGNFFKELKSLLFS